MNTASLPRVVVARFLAALAAYVQVIVYTSYPTLVTSDVDNFVLSRQ